MSIVLSNGKHTIELTTMFTDGYRTRSSISVIIDTIPPTIEIISHENGSITGPTVTLSWSYDDNYHVDHIELRIDDGSWIDIGFIGTYTIHLGEGVHIIYVKAVDEAGNSAVDSVTLNVDATPPTINVVAPANKSYILTRELRVEWTASDNYGVDFFEVRIDHSDWIYVGNNTTYTFIVDIPGEHIIYIAAYDVVSNMRIISVVINVDLENPVIELIYPKNNTETTNSTLTIMWNVYDDVGIDHVEIRIDDSEWINIGENTSYTVEFKEGGTHTITIKAVDNAGRTTTITLVVTIKSLTTTSPSQPQGHTVNTTLLLIAGIIIILAILVIAIKYAKKR